MSTGSAFLHRRDLALGLAAIALLSGGVGTAAAARTTWPERAVRLFTPAAPGSSTDLAARLYAERLAARWGQSVLVEAKPGADGAIAVKAMLQQRDGHALLFGPTGVLTITPLLNDHLSFDPVADVAPLSLGALDFLCLAISPALEGVSDLTDLVRLARQRPGVLNAAAGLGGPYMALVSFLRGRDLHAALVPYRSPPEALADLAAGRLHLLVGPLAPVLPLLRDGRIRLAAVTNPERSLAVPDVPTAAEQGFPELELEGTLGFMGPSAMPEDLRARIAADIAIVASDPRLAERLRASGVMARAEAPAAFTARLERQRAHWADVARRHGLRPS